MNILVTGGCGFIGSHVCDRLIFEGHQVVCYDNFDSYYSKDVKLMNIANAQKSNLFILKEADVLKQEVLEETFKKYNFEAVVHLAAKTGVRPSIQNPKEYISTNVVGTHNVLLAMQKFNCKNLIFASSSSVYGNNKKIPFSELDNVDYPISPYAATKKSCELLTYNYHHLYDINVINFRFFTVFGPRQRPDLAIHKFFKQLYYEQPIDIYGDGNTGRDYTYVDDIVDGIMKGIKYIMNANKKVYEVVNLGNNNPLKLMDLLKHIEHVSQKKFKRNYLPMQAGDVDFTYADINKAKKILGYTPQTDIIEGLKKFKNWFENNKT